MKYSHNDIVRFYSCAPGSSNVICLLTNGKFAYFKKDTGAFVQVSVVVKDEQSLPHNRRTPINPPHWYMPVLLRVSEGL